MANIPVNTAGGPGDAPVLRALADNRRNFGIALLVLGVALAAIPITYGVLYGWNGLEFIVWGAMLSLAFLGTGLTFVLSAPRPDFSGAEQVRLAIMILGGVVGFATALWLGLVLPLHQYQSVFGGGLQEWSKNRWTVLGCAAAVFGGLGLMFGSLLLGRGAERTNPLMRRLLYGYNAFFSSFLLLTVLILVNVLCYSPLPLFGSLNRTYDWTASGVYTLSPATQAQLAALKQPVKVVLLLSGGDKVLPALKTMLDNCEAVTPFLTYQTRNPELMDPDEQESWMRKYELPKDMNGMLVIYGTEPKVYFTFVKESELYEDSSRFNPEEPQGAGKNKFTFKGEAALTTAIDYLEEGKSKPIIYFTQGNGELAFSAAEGGDQRPKDSMSILIDNVGTHNFDLRTLTLGPDLKEIPPDASVVVLARPRNPLPQAAVNALRNYLKGAEGKHGKLIAMFGVVAPSGVPLKDAPLEALLAEYDVRALPDRILTIDGIGDNSPPTQLVVVPNERSSNRIAQVFARVGANFLFDDARTVEPLPNHPEYKAEILLQTFPQWRVWSQEDLRADPVELANDVRKQAEAGKFTKFSPRPLPVAVTVSEAKEEAPIPGHEFMAQQSGQPVMAVFGDASWVSNDSLQGEAAQPNYNLFLSTLAWMREKANLGPQIKTKAGAERQEFSMEKITPDVASRIAWATGGVMLVAIIVLGLGVALVRRR